MARIGLLHPGEMGAGLAAELVEAGHEIFWAAAGRSAQTAERAATAGLTPADDIPALVTAVDGILSICPPHAALEIGTEVGAAGFAGIYVDANAISPSLGREVAEAVEAGGAQFVDGGIIGVPPGGSVAPRLYLSGVAADTVADWFAPTPIEAPVLDSDPFAASSLKMVHAAWTKGTTALLIEIDAAARESGVDGALAEEWKRVRPWYGQELETARANAARKSWRWVREMEEVASTFEALGLPPGFHRAAAELFASFEPL